LGAFFTPTAYRYAIATGTGARASRSCALARCGAPSMTEWDAGHDTAARVPQSPPCARLFGRGVVANDTDGEGPVLPAIDERRVPVARLSQPPRLAPSLTAPRFPRRIETDRLRLEMPTSEDFDALGRMAADSSMFRYSERGAMSQEESWNLLLRHVGYWLLAGYGVFTVREKQSGRFAGLVGGSSFHRSLGAAFDDFPEMTWSIASQFRGQGYASEAAAAVIDALEAQPVLKSTVCLIHVDNQPSLRVASKLGFRFFRHCEYRGYRAGLFCR
jgi:RimJ/RimL family protein N-acetyltransferase